VGAHHATTAQVFFTREGHLHEVGDEVVFRQVVKTKEARNDHKFPAQWTGQSVSVSLASEAHLDAPETESVTARQHPGILEYRRADGTVRQLLNLLRCRRRHRLSPTHEQNRDSATCKQI